MSRTDLSARNPFAPRLARITGPLIVVALLVAACGSTGTHAAESIVSKVTHATTSTTHVPRPGTASVGFAGSTQVVNEQVVGPAFTAATGYAYQGQGAGSSAVAQYIQSGEYTSNVFESVGNSAIQTVEPAFSKYFVEFATTPLVIAYNPAGPFAARFSAIASGKKPLSDLFALLASPGLKIGRTDPNVDPQGEAFLIMLKLARSRFHFSATTANAIVANSQIFSEDSLESTLQAGELDASSAYLSQAIQMKLPYIALPDTINLGEPADVSYYEKASITLTQPAGQVVKGGLLPLCISVIKQQGESPADIAAANAFVGYVLSPAGLAEFHKEGYTLLPVTLYGSKAGVPKSILSEVKMVSAAPATTTTVATTASTTG